MANTKKNQPKKTMEKSLKSAGRKLKSMLAKTDRSDVNGRIGISVLLKRTVAKAKNENKAITELAKEMKYNRQSLYRMVRPAKVWSVAEMREMAKQTNKDGWALTWSYFEVLATAKEERREDLFKRALKEALTVSKLEAVIKTGRPKRKVKESDENAPRTKIEVKIAKNLCDWVGGFESEITFWGSTLKNDVRKELDEGRAPMLVETVERMTRAAKAMQDMADELKEMLLIVPTAMGQFHQLKAAPVMATTAAM